MTLIRINGQLEPDSTNARMKRLLAKIETEEDRKRLKLLNRAWWAEFFGITREEKRAA